MAKLRGKAKAAFLRKMAKGRKKGRKGRKRGKRKVSKRGKRRVRVTFYAYR